MVDASLFGRIALARAAGPAGRREMRKQYLIYVLTRSTVMQPAILILPPTVTVATFAMIQSAEIQAPWGPILNSGVAGLMAWVFYRLTLRLLDEAREVRNQGVTERKEDREHMAELIRNNTAALGAYTQAVGDFRDGLNEMKEVAAELKSNAVCPFRDQQEGRRHQSKHGD